MPEPIHDIVLAVREVRRLTEDIAKLLRTARDRFDNLGWKPRTTQSISVSTSLNYARTWIPQDAFLFLLNQSRPNHLVLLSVLFDSVDNAATFLMPVVSVGYLQCAEAVKENWSPSWSRASEWVGPRHDGSFQRIPIEKMSIGGNIIHGEIATIPLERIINADSMEQLLIQPLLGKMTESEVVHEAGSSSTAE
jgi:hypothetical protein